MTDHQWNRVSNQEPFGSEADTLPLGHRGLLSLLKQPGEFLDQVVSITAHNSEIVVDLVPGCLFRSHPRTESIRLLNRVYAWDPRV
ncbi:hypothetical protein AVEN_200501-1 [Araneus ventricosus]|uniref:Uncharacterized protein n=1 Tax=Araneus ventricosus TaxID=182803 RepID=A0A4Y2RBK3_ARAVE|nr:hypothetical protein AVEN_200501-1 [Araneus ventricosus]